ncbi:hypothetical protein AAFF_G00052930 [Aldrovandia affinis]|uniref:Max-like protein X n=1 Tax=Aldrovandia affinis TaxID=143900 RepID=A0AAD7T5N3_9TELE|nr:hypothetical protein AAFF_G00052930 [Aldrovandia affinis]
MHSHLLQVETECPQQQRTAALSGTEELASEVSGQWRRIFYIHAHFIFSHPKPMAHRDIQADGVFSDSSFDQNDEDSDYRQETSYKESYKDRRRKAHTQAEQKRRDAIKKGYDDLQSIVPTCQQQSEFTVGSQKISKATVLQKSKCFMNLSSIDYIQFLHKEKKKQEEEVSMLRKEVMALKIMKINYEHIVKAHQDNPQQGEDNVSDQVKFRVFQNIMDSLFQSFSASISVSSFQELSACVFRWLEEHCKPQEEDLAQSSVGVLLEHADKLLARAGVDPLVMVHVVTNDMGRCRSPVTGGDEGEPIADLGADPSGTSGQRRSEMTLVWPEAEIEVLLAEVQMRAGTLFGSLSSGFTSTTKYVAWQSVAQAVNEVHQRGVRTEKRRDREYLQYSNIATRKPAYAKLKPDVELSKGERVLTNCGRSFHQRGTRTEKRRDREERCQAPGGMGQSVCQRRRSGEVWTGNGRILRMLWREKRQVRVIAAIWLEKHSWLSRVTPRLLADWDGDTMEPSTVIDASIIGEPFAGRKSSSVFPRFSFRWWVDIHAEMSARHAEIRAGTWVSDGGKERNRPSTEPCGTPVERVRERRGSSPGHLVGPVSQVEEKEDGAKGSGLSDVKSLCDRKESSLCGVACSEPRLKMASDSAVLTECRRSFQHQGVSSEKRRDREEWLPGAQRDGTVSPASEGSS